MATGTRPRGRPRSPGKREAILVSAGSLFLRHGPDGVSLDVVIGQARASKATFYSNFALLELR